MPIVWKTKYKIIIDCLHTGKSVADTAKELKVGYSSLCKFLSSISLDNKGHFKKPIKKTPQLEAFFKDFILKENSNLTAIYDQFKITPAQFQSLMKSFTLHKEWDFKNSTSENIAFGRKGELFIKSLQDFRIVKDCIKQDSKSPYDLVITPNAQFFNPSQNPTFINIKFGAVDVKATKLRPTTNNKHRHKFNVENVTKPTNFVFALGYDETSTNPMILLLLPYKLICKAQSISVSVEDIATSKYAPYIYRIFDTPQSSLYPEDLRKKYMI